MTALLVVAVITGFVGAVVVPVLPVRLRVLATSSVLIGDALAALVVAVHVLTTGRALGVSTHAVFLGSGVALRIDPLGAFFVVLTSLVVIAVAVYEIGYSSTHPMTRTAAGALCTFAGAMLSVPVAWNVTGFLFFWEIMAASSLALILTDYRRGAPVRSAALWYAVLTQAGAALVMIALVVMAVSSRSQGFTVIARHLPSLSPGLRTTVFLLTFAGFASKAGAVPLHVWLPKAHAESPSPVSALMSAAMVNLGIYGVIRVGLEWFHGGTVWWWVLVLALGGLSAIYGSIHAATNTDLKRLLAYSTIDNVGLIFMALGTAGILLSIGHIGLADLALFAALLHITSHSLFKGTLFLSAGSLQFSTGTRDLDLMGGLLTRVPFASSVFALGSMAIMALPPLSGFVSEWFLLQSLLHGMDASSPVTTVALPLSVAALALTGGLTAAAFVKVLGVGLLGVPRSAYARDAKEPPVSMNLAAGLLAMLSVVIGFAPMVLVGSLTRVVRSALNDASPVRVHGTALEILGSRGVVDPTMIAVALVVALVLVASARRLLDRGRVTRRAVWGFGRLTQSSRMTYTATAFAEPLQRVFDDVLRPNHDLDVSHHGESRYFVESARFRSSADDAFERLVYRPLIRMVRALADRVRFVQNGSVHWYLGYGLAALVVLLLMVR